MLKTKQKQLRYATTNTSMVRYQKREAQQLGTRQPQECNTKPMTENTIKKRSHITPGKVIG